jgi:hypothetical protein
MALDSITTTKIRDDRAERPVAPGVRAEAAAPSDLPSASERSTQRRLDSLNLDDKMKLGPQESDTLRKVEASILRGDSKGVEDLLHQYKDRPGALTPIMDVLTKDLHAAGIDANYSVNFPMTDAGSAARSGMLSLDTAKNSVDSFTGDNRLMCFYTNPASSTWANRELGHDTHDGYYHTPASTKIPNNEALQDIAARATRTLAGK